MTSGAGSERPEVAPQEPLDTGAAAGADSEVASDQPASDQPVSVADWTVPVADQADEQVPDQPAETARDLAAELAERTSDLQRLQAEFLNYKRRVDRDRELVRENAVFAVLTPMLDVLDSIDRARAAGELEGGFKGVADQFERIVAGLGLLRFGEPGDAFDPTMHEALSHIGTDPEATVVTAKHVAKTGYRIGDRVVRAAQVLVVDPEEPSDA